jgi:hypothetical protein
MNVRYSLSAALSGGSGGGVFGGAGSIGWSDLGGLGKPLLMSSVERVN